MFWFLFAPQSTIYPRDEEELGVENTLIYSVNHFFPSSVKVNWTNNSLEVTEGASLSWCNLTKDGTFHQFSTVSFTPQKGDFYACTVAHTALKDPKTRFWEPEFSEVSASSTDPAVFCGVGLALGLLGVATGTFLIIKGNQCN
ncbi:H-2 class II histocompatibility antigen, A-R alpha chain-like [Coregonus clupeaformis]|uniref:H-2 class II histocompatibility antigen, A-R alpha chain-like n=1 Tax=Coregonus clupeaformis TaxID=59861 RepID=UPI001BE072C0|nr:H-2 class II histocompatibility antigen, A-R alpha chain-like [Coregonus clupeaformis]